MKVSLSSWDVFFPCFRLRSSSIFPTEKMEENFCRWKQRTQLKSCSSSVEIYWLFDCKSPREVELERAKLNKAKVRDAVWKSINTSSLPKRPVITLMKIGVEIGDESGLGESRWRCAFVASLIETFIERVLWKFSDNSLFKLNWLRLNYGRVDHDYRRGFWRI